MKRISWLFWLSIFFILLSSLIYFIHFEIFKDVHHIFIYLIGDIAFVPIEVLLVTIIIHRLLSVREKRNMLKKLNMVIGAFFSEVGTRLLQSFSKLDPDTEEVRRELIMKQDWSNKEFKGIVERLKSCKFDIDRQRGDLGILKKFLVGKRQFLLALLENPNLLEHDTFTDLLWAVFHLTEELDSRDDIYNLPESDYKHLEGDIKRSYSLLVREWLDYMKHLKDDYPYLFSLAVRMNPFNLDASPIVKG